MTSKNKQTRQNQSDSISRGDGSSNNNNNNQSKATATVDSATPRRSAFSLSSNDANNNNPLSSVSVFVNNADGSEIAAKLTGHFVVQGKEFKFTAIAFGRIGGHNASVKVSKSTLAKVKEIGIDSEALIDIIQRKIVEGDIILPEGIKPPSAPSSSE